MMLYLFKADAASIVAALASVAAMVVRSVSVTVPYSVLQIMQPYIPFKSFDLFRADGASSVAAFTPVALKANFAKGGRRRCRCGVFV